MLVAGVMRNLITTAVAPETSLDQTERNEDGAVVRAGDVWVTELRIGDCALEGFDALAHNEIVKMRAVPCSESHNLEVVGLPQYPEPQGAKYPGGANLAQFASQRCIEAFRSYTKQSVAKSVVDVGFVVPTAESWNKVDDRGIICLLYGPTGTHSLISSFRDSGEGAGPAETSIWNLEVGDCFTYDPAMGDLVFAFVVVPCDERHNREVFHNFNLEPDEFPGNEAIDNLADAGCERAFEQYVGLGYNNSKFYLFTITPNADNWAADDRGVTCILGLDSLGLDPMIGSKRGSEQ